MIGAETFSRHPRLDRPRHLRAVRRRRRRGRARCAGAARQARGSRHPHRAAALRRPPQIEALCRRRPVLDRHRRPSAHGGPRGVPSCRGDDHRRGRGRLQGDRLHAPPTSTGSFRTRPTSASSTVRRTSSALRRRKSSSRSTGTATPRRPRSRWRLPTRSPTAASSAATCLLLEAMGGGFTWGAALVRW